MLLRPFSLLSEENVSVASIWKKNGMKIHIALSQTDLKPARRERDVVNQHQPIHGPVKELYNSHQPVQLSVQFPFNKFNILYLLNRLYQLDILCLLNRRPHPALMILQEVVVR